MLPGGKLSGHLKETLMRVYDVRPTIAGSMMDISEIIERIAKQEYIRGRIDMYEEIRKDPKAQP